MAWSHHEKNNLGIIKWKNKLNTNTAQNNFKYSQRFSVFNYKLYAYLENFGDVPRSWLIECGLFGKEFRFPFEYKPLRKKLLPKQFQNVAKPIRNTTYSTNGLLLLLVTFLKYIWGFPRGYLKLIRKSILLQSMI